MEVLYPQCAGLDVHKDTVVGCVRIARGAKATRALRTFGTTTRELLALADWLKGRDTYLRAQFHRLKSHRGAKKAIVAVAASMLSAAYHMLCRDVAWRDLGGDYFDRHQHQRLARRLVHRLTQLGYQVEIRDAA
jgi:hypothetical protein